MPLIIDSKYPQYYKSELETVGISGNGNIAEEIFVILMPPSGMRTKLQSGVQKGQETIVCLKKQNKTNSQCQLNVLFVVLLTLASYLFPI